MPGFVPPARRGRDYGVASPNTAEPTAGVPSVSRTDQRMHGFTARFGLRASDFAPKDGQFFPDNDLREMDPFGTRQNWAELGRIGQNWAELGRVRQSSAEFGRMGQDGSGWCRPVQRRGQAMDPMMHCFTDLRIHACLPAGGGSPMRVPSGLGLSHCDLSEIYDLGILGFGRHLRGPAHYRTLGIAGPYLARLYAKNGAKKPLRNFAKLCESLRIVANRCESLRNFPLFSVSFRLGGQPWRQGAQLEQRGQGGRRTRGGSFAGVVVAEGQGAGGAGGDAFGGGGLEALGE